MGDELLQIPGVGHQTLKRLERLGIESVNDFLTFLPRRYLARVVLPVRELAKREGEWATVAGSVESVRSRRTQRRGVYFTEVRLSDGTGQLLLAAFHKGPRPGFPVSLGERVAASGVVRRSGARVQMGSPLVEIAPGALCAGDELPPVCVYPLTEGITRKRIASWIRWVLEHRAPSEWMSDDDLGALALPRLPDALRALHAPRVMADIEPGRRRLALEELVGVYLRALSAESRRARVSAKVCPRERLSPESFAAGLPFTLTRAQRDAVGVISEELASSRPMRRLLYGDVGSGKTVVAAFAALRAFLCGYQAVVVAPTRLLAEQHRRTLARLLEPWGVGVELMTSELPREERAALLRRLRSGEPLILCATHAFLTEDVDAPRAAVCVIDEHHRFGVAQRREIDQKVRSHLLAMTATPIPRTLARLLYADLDVSLLDEKPPGRQRVDTRWIHPDRRPELYAFMVREVKRGRQAYVVFPRVDADDDGVRTAVREARALAEGALSGLKLGLLHGRMHRAEADETMEAFVRGDIDVLVATTVIEVGVDVPNATVMVVEEADRFGLAQLHQLRGRVGRGEHQGYCLLVADPASDDAKRRLDALRRTDDGMRIAEMDLQLRGAGELFGLRQAGRSEFKAFDLTKDGDLLRHAPRLAQAAAAQRTTARDREHTS